MTFAATTFTERLSRDTNKGEGGRATVSFRDKYVRPVETTDLFNGIHPEVLIRTMAMCNRLVLALDIRGRNSLYHVASNSKIASSTRLSSSLDNGLSVSTSKS